MRVDLYTFVHKAQRFHMFRLSETIGLADLSQIAETENLSSQLLELMEHLKDHSENEKKYIHPLYQKLGSVGVQLDEDHERLETEIQNIVKIVKDKAWKDLYPAYAKFIGVYLLHLEEEEAAQRDVLWKQYEDDTLAVVFMRFKAERPPHLAKKDFEYMLPALSVPELIQMFRGIKTSASTSVFQGVCNTAARLLTKNKWDKIAAGLN